MSDGDIGIVPTCKASIERFNATRQSIDEMNHVAYLIFITLVECIDDQDKALIF